MTPSVARAMANGNVTVTADGELEVSWDGEARRIDTGVEPNFALSPDGRLLAWSRERSPVELELVVAPTDDPSAQEVVSGDLATADRPVFAGPRELVFVGAVNDGVAGIWVVDIDARVPHPLTNAHLMAGTGQWDGFIPPPADPDSIRVEDRELVYHDGEQEQRVALDGADAR